MRRLEVALSALALALLALGAAVLPVESVAFTRAYSERYATPESTGLTLRQTTSLAEKVRAHVTGGAALPGAPVSGRSFTAGESGHLADVRSVIVGARAVTLLLFAGVAFWVALRARSSSGRRAIASAFLAAGALLGGAIVGCVALSLLDFDALFSAFHSVFFAEGTWMFPENSLLIGLFPMEFWTKAAVWWAGFALAEAVVMLSIGWVMRRRRAVSA